MFWLLAPAATAGRSLERDMQKLGVPADPVVVAFARPAPV
jgi:hypothetical protein